MRSALDSIPGIGQKRKALLLNQFKSVPKIREATLDELSALPGVHRKLAAVIKQNLQQPGA
jgi:excinuclease ABC subunit C